MDNTTPEVTERIETQVPTVEVVGTEPLATTDESNNLNVSSYFQTMVYTLDKPEFLTPVRTVFYKHLEAIKDGKEVNHPIMTDNLVNEESILDFLKYGSSTGWNILSSQGFKMNDKIVAYESVWGQHYNKTTQMDQHVHSNGVQLVGFYFLDVPTEGSPRVLIHDPRIGKNQINMEEAEVSQVTAASSIINFIPKPGMFFFTNAWLAHSFTRHESEEPFNFIHFNLGVDYNHQGCDLSAKPDVEVI